MSHDPIFSYYKDCDFSNTPLIVFPYKTRPEGFIAGHAVEKRLADETWQTIGFQGENKPCTTHLRLATGELVHDIARPANVAPPAAGEEHLPTEIALRDGDGFVRLEPLPEGWYRVAGLELTRAELLGLLPKLQPGWEGVLFATGGAGEYAFWEAGGGYGNWCQFRLERETLAEAADISPRWLHHQLSEAGPHTLYRIHYLDPMRPGVLPGLSNQHGFCVGYNRPNGPEMLLNVEPLLLREYWPIDSLREVLTAEELAAANLAVVNSESIN